MSGPLGEYYVNGRHHFMAAYSFLTNLNSQGFGPYVISTAPPTLTGRPVITDFTVSAPSAPGTGFEITVDNPNAESIVYMGTISQPLSASRNFWKGPWDSTSTLSDTIASEGTDDLVFTGLIEDSVYFARIRAITTGAPHRMTIEHIIRATAQTTAP